MPSDARHIWENSFVISAVYLHTIVFNEMYFMLQISSSVFGHVKAIDIAAFLLKCFYSWGKFVCWYFVGIAEKPQPPVLSEDCTDIVGHSHKLPQGKCVDIRDLDWHWCKFAQAICTISVPQIFQMRGKRANLEEIFLLFFTDSASSVYFLNKRQRNVFCMH